jgi:hypothetical protein
MPVDQATTRGRPQRDDDRCRSAQSVFADPRCARMCHFHRDLGRGRSARSTVVLAMSVTSEVMRRALADELGGRTSGGPRWRGTGGENHCYGGPARSDAGPRPTRIKIWRGRRRTPPVSAKSTARTTPRSRRSETDPRPSRRPVRSCPRWQAFDRHPRIVESNRRSLQAGRACMAHPLQHRRAGSAWRALRAGADR